MLRKKVNSTADTKRFYSQLMQGHVTRGVLGMNQRFNSSAILRKPTIEKYFSAKVVQHINKDDNVLDLGCGTGAFTIALSHMCRSVLAVDVVADFVQETERAINEAGLSNAKAIYQAGEIIPCEESSIDVVVMVDVIHHLENIDGVMYEVKRVLKPGGKVIVFEPNKLNPLIYFMHLLDRNEWGLLRLGTPGIYKKILTKFLEVDQTEFSGLVIGPDNRIFFMVADFLSRSRVYPWLGWLLPKMLVVGRQR
jgi:ubiquinone/menaquinone biosynthesis C-methylase UbiE